MGSLIHSFALRNGGHIAVDVVPWLMWGNTRDTTYLDAF